MTKKRMKTPGKARHPTALAGEMKGPVLNTGYSHGGASLTRQALRGYNPVKSSSKSDVDANLNVLRNRSADMYINSPLGASAINTSRAHIIGAGLTLSAKINYRILGMSAEQAIEWQHSTKAEFDLWADSLECDLYRKNKQRLNTASRRMIFRIAHGCSCSRRPGFVIRVRSRQPAMCRTCWWKSETRRTGIVLSTA